MDRERTPIGDRTALLFAPVDEIGQLIRRAHHEWLAALDTIKDPIFMHDAEYRVTRSNRAYANLAGLSVKEVIGKPYYAMFPKRDGPLPLCAHLADGGGEGEEEVAAENGRTYLSRTASVTDADGRFLYALHIMYDVTERKQMELAVRDGEERLRLAFSAARQSWFDLDVASSTASISPEYAGMMGYDAEPFSANFADWAESLHAEDQARVKQAFARCLELGGPVSVEFRQHTKSGDWIWLSSVAKVVEADEKGRARRIIGVMTDITERKQAEIALSTSEARFQSMFESLGEGVLLYSKSGVIQLCNPAAERILGLVRDDVMGARSAVPGWVTLRDDGTPLPREDLPVSRTLSTGSALNNVVVGMQKPSAEVQWLNVNSEPLFDRETGEVVAAIVSFEDITVRKHSEERLLQLNHALKTIGDCNRTLVFAEDEQQLLQDMCTVIVESGGYPAAWVGYAERDEGKSVQLRAHRGLDESAMQGTSMTWADNDRGQWPVGRAIRSGEIQLSAHGGAEPHFRGIYPGMPGPSSCIALPLKEKGLTIGSLNIYAHEVQGFSEDEVRMLQELADDLGFGIGTMRLRRDQERMLVQLRKELEGTVQAVSSMVEMRDPYTAGHERRVAELADAIAAEMGLPEEQARGIRLAGTIHDLGKIQIPAEILSKPGRLTEVEFKLIRQHPETGYEILKNIEFPWPIAQAVLQHHERLDGSGYPHGIKGDAILLEARILAVSDVVEAMASHRPYRPGLGLPAAMQEVRQHRGTYYDPDVVDACVRLFEEKGYTLTEPWAAHKAA
jgi:PAS domain S-box-containing protein/putative nucleotidyltransferase with HDIG domain